MQESKASLGRVFVFIAATAFLSGCANVDRYLRPEGSFYIPQPSAIDGLKLDVAGTSVRVNCLDKDGSAVTRDGLNKNDIQCLYYAADATDVLSAFKTSASQSYATLTETRNYYTSFLLNLSDQNCETFLNRAFANKSSVDTTKNTFQDILTGASAAIANATPHTAAGLSLSNLVLGKAVENINTAFFFEKTFQAIGSAIYLERSDLKEQITKKSNQTYQKYTIFDALADIRRYESACSIRVGVSRLQSLADDRAREKMESEKRYLALVEAISQKQVAELRIQQLEKEKSEASKTTAEKEAIEAELKKVKAEKEKADKQIAALQEVVKAKAEEETARATAKFSETKKQAEAPPVKTPEAGSVAVGASSDR